MLPSAALFALSILAADVAPRTTSVSGTSRLVETRRTGPSGHEEISWTRNETRVHLLVDHRRYGTRQYHYVLKEESLLEWNDGSEGVVSKLTFSRLDRTRTGYDSLAWTVDIPAENSSFFDGMIQTLRYGCCDQEDEYRYLAPATGRLIATTSDRPIPLHAPNQGLYLGYRPPPRPRARSGKSELRIGAVLLFSADSLLDELPIPLEPQETWTPIMSDLGNAIRLEFDEGESVTLAVTPDRKVRRVETSGTP